MAQFSPFLLLDLAASFMLAAAASCRARSGGAHFSGAAVLACLAGLAAPLLRDVLTGSAVLALNRGEYLGVAVAGSFAGAVAARWRHGPLAFYCLDGLGLALASGLGAVRGAVFGLGATGCLVLGVVAALAGGLVRDIALGDTVMAVEEDMYGTAAALGAMLALVAFVYARLPDWQCVLAGALLALALRMLWLRREKSLWRG